MTPMSREFITILATFITLFGGLCIWLVKVNNKRFDENFEQHKEIFNKLGDKVTQPNCHNAQKELKHHIDIRINDLCKKLDMAVEFLNKNGK